MARISDLLKEHDENLARVEQLADDVVANSHVSLLGLLFGDVPSTVAWKIMYLSYRNPSIEDRCTMLSVVTDYIVNTPALLQMIPLKSYNPPQMIRVLAECWEHALFAARTGLDADSFVTFNLTLARSVLTLRSYNLHHDMNRVLKLSAKLRDPNCDLTTVNRPMPPNFPQRAVIPARKRIQLMSGTSCFPLPVTNQNSHVTTSHCQTTPLDSHTTAAACLSTASASHATSPVRQTTAPASLATNPVHQSTASNAISPIRQTTVPNATTPVRQATASVIYTTSTGGQTTPPCYHITTPPTSSPYFATTPLSKTTSSALHATDPSRHSAFAPSVSPAARSLIRAELERLHLVRSSPAMPLHSSLSSKLADRRIFSTGKHMAGEAHGAASCVSPVTDVDDLRQSVHTDNSRSSLHPKDRAVMKELYFNPE